jgi:predicted nucleic acid-binding Zn ribbon protein
MNLDNIHSLKDLINQLIELNDWTENIAFVKIKENWDQILGKNFAEHIEPKKLKDGVLHLKADSSTWRTEMLIRKEQIIERINFFLNQNLIKTVKIR